MLTLANQGAGGCRQTALKVADFVVIGAPQPVEQLRVAPAAEPLGVKGASHQAPRRSRLRFQHAAQRRGQLGETDRVSGPAARARQPGQMVERIGNDDGGAAA
jgi:hypothetical protein